MIAAAPCAALQMTASIPSSVRRRATAAISWSGDAYPFQGASAMGGRLTVALCDPDPSLRGDEGLFIAGAVPHRPARRTSRRSTGRSSSFGTSSDRARRGDQTRVRADGCVSAGVRLPTHGVDRSASTVAPGSGRGCQSECHDATSEIWSRVVYGGQAASSVTLTPSLKVTPPTTSVSISDLLSRLHPLCADNASL